MEGHKKGRIKQLELFLSFWSFGLYCLHGGLHKQLNYMDISFVIIEATQTTTGGGKNINLHYPFLTHGLHLIF